MLKKEIWRTSEDSATCCKNDFHLVTGIIASNQWKIHSANVKSAFLLGKGINRCLWPSKEVETKLWKLQTAVYGLCDAPRVWCLSVKDALKKWGAIYGKFDDSLFYWHKDDKLQGLICFHVDNFFWVGTKNVEENVINVLSKTFKTIQEEFENFKYFGLHIEQKQDCIYLEQQIYIDELKEFQICEERKMSKESSLKGV